MCSQETFVPERAERFKADGSKPPLHKGSVRLLRETSYERLVNLELHQSCFSRSYHTPTALTALTDLSFHR